MAFRQLDSSKKTMNEIIFKNPKHKEPEKIYKNGAFLTYIKGFIHVIFRRKPQHKTTIFITNEKITLMLWLGEDKISPKDYKRYMKFLSTELQ